MCLYTHGVVRDSDMISAARFDLEWMDEAYPAAAAPVRGNEGAEGGQAVVALTSRPSKL